VVDTPAVWRSYSTHTLVAPPSDRIEGSAGGRCIVTPARAALLSDGRGGSPPGQESHGPGVELLSASG